MGRWKGTDRALRELEAVLPANGSRSAVDVARALDDWIELARDTTRYDGMIEEYLNDVSSRDVLQRVCGLLGRSAPMSLMRPMQDADLRFSRVTIPDERGLLARYYKIDARSGWWWHRIPASGPIADLLRE